MMRNLPLFTLLVATLIGCAHAEFQTPQQFAELEQHGTYEQRATTAQGVVVAVREIDLDHPLSMSFLCDAISERLTRGQGYAPLTQRDVRAKSGHSGKLLTFGRDQNGRTFDYWVAIFPTKDRLVLMEMGGRREHFDKQKPALERALAGLTVR